MPGQRDSERGARPDVEIGARVKAKRLRFKSRPRTDVRTQAEPDGPTSSQSERKNLPDEVEPGVTYRDVELRWRAAARIRPRGERKT
ncbi:MAG: hypothetical protein ABR581_00045 [Thermoleophilaceae bacterium]